ncbi:hypothetical protein ACH4MN_14060 [Streptomyces anulatus]|jgi:hypothetical protein|uniref:hypothetical protein n=1 Tax=unclassified Streptomyces TaxID=2593676 RepID=UPI000851D245|nr:MULTISPECIES: hypothetical protein [unclassified Streptomyces]MDX3487887.1 hypothetical protein [Streptomyces sp. ID05-18]
MPPSTGDQYSISIGGDASGTVVAGHGNQVEVHRTGEPEPEAAADAAAADANADAVAGATQRTTVRDHGTAYTVMRGELNIHHAAPGRSPEPEED